MDTPSLTQSNKKVSLSFKRCVSHGVAAMRYCSYANGFWFDSHLADFPLLFLFSGLHVPFMG